MSLDSKIDSIYKSISDNLYDLDFLRIEAKKRRNMTWVYGSAVLIVVAFFIFQMRQQIPQWGLITIEIVSVIAFIIFTAIYNAKSREFSARFSTEVIPSIILGFIPDATFNPQGHVGIEYYDHSQLFTTGWDRYDGRNKVTGTVGSTHIAFSELHTEYKTERKTKNGTQTEWHTIFKGIFMVVDCNKHFKAQTIVLPDTAEKIFGSLGKWMQKNTAGKRELVYMESKEFEKNFAVYSTNPVEARYLITPQMQERLLDLKRHTGGVRLSFVNKELYIAIHRSGGIFRPNFSMTLTDPQTIKHYARDIIDIISIVDILDLNTRIWGKD